jgi:outer membrane immunogenic protein
MRRLGPGLVALAMASLAVAAPAIAADLPTAPAYYPPAAFAPALYDWTGFYFGGHVGGALLADSINPASGIVPPTVMHGTIKIGPVDLVGGGQIGVNYEFAPWVVGIEGTLTASAISGTGTVGATSVTVPTLSGESFTSAPTWLVTATGRLGYAANTLLFYAKGGAAWMRVDYTQNQFVGLSNIGTQVITDNRSGLTAGLGVEYGMTENLSAKFEYDFFDFGTKTYNFIATPVTVQSQIHVVTVGLNYRFNWAGGGGPVVAAKY